MKVRGQKVRGKGSRFRVEGWVRLRPQSTGFSVEGFVV